MLLLKPDPTFYPSAKLAMQAPAEGLAYVATVQRNGKPDALRVVDLDANSPTYGQFVHTLELPYVGDELHHLGSSQGAQLEVYTLHSLLHAIQQRLTLVVMLFCGG